MKKIFIISLFIILFLASYACKAKEANVLLIEARDSFVSNTSSLDGYTTLIKFVYNTQRKVDAVFVAGPYVKTLGDLSLSGVLSQTIDSSIDQSMDLESCTVTTAQMLLAINEKVALSGKKIKQLNITTESRIYPRMLIEAFYLFEADDEQKEWIKTKIEEAISNFNNKEKDIVISEMISQVKKEQKKNDKMDIKINRSGFMNLTDDKEDIEKFDETLLELKALYDENTEKELINNRLTELSQDANDPQIAKDYLVSKGCSENLYIF